MISLNLNEVSQLIHATNDIQSEVVISGVNDLANATVNQITFIGSAKYKRFIETTKAAAVVVSHGIEITNASIPLLYVKNADLAMAQLLEAFSPKQGPEFETNIHPTASIHHSVVLGEGVKVGAFVYIGPGVSVGKGTQIYANVSVFDNSKIGENCTIWSGTVIRENSQIGHHCIFHNNVSIGADGFGYRPAPDGSGLIKIPHIGNVVIGNHVEIGANSCVDKAKFNSTILGDGCKIDNLVQIAHNCVLGRSCIMAGSSGLAGSVTLGDGVIIGGSASIKDHVTIGSGATVGAGSGVIADVPPKGSVLGYPATESREMLKQWVALKRLAKQ